MRRTCNGLILSSLARNPEYFKRLGARIRATNSIAPIATIVPALNKVMKKKGAEVAVHVRVRTHAKSPWNREATPRCHTFLISVGRMGAPLFESRIKTVVNSKSPCCDATCTKTPSFRCGLSTTRLLGPSALIAALSSSVHASDITTMADR